MLIKKSITIKKHRTSLSLEKEFWNALKIIANEQNCSMENLVTKIDANRKATLASSIRVYILKFYMKD
jgi:predicted DNA-binding ribbon-helix-helix protein